jgi:outer membrane protein
MPLQQAIQFALENRPELKQADYEIQNQDITVAYRKNQLLPSLDISVGYTQTGLGGTQTRRAGQGGDIIQIIPGGLGDLFTQLGRFDFNGYSAGFNLEIPLRNRAARADYEQAANDRQLSGLKKSALAQRIALEVRNAYTQIQMTRARVDTARTAHQLAARVLEAEQKKFELGTSTVRFVLEDQRELAQAESNEIQALVNFTKALVGYDQAIGNTLRRNNIELEKQLPKQLSSVN